MFVNVIKSYRDVVAVCDKELLGKKFEEGKFQLDVKESFFKGKESSREEAFEIMRDMKLEDSTFNIIGEKSVQTALEAGIITKDGIGRIADIPFAFVLM
ncbi:MAG: DUF424 family protein [Nanoarchaeota archaeon]